MIERSSQPLVLFILLVQPDGRVNGLRGKFGNSSQMLTASVRVAAAPRDSMTEAADGELKTPSDAWSFGTVAPLRKLSNDVPRCEPHGRSAVIPLLACLGRKWVCGGAHKKGR
jgi:hypothetical protein